MGELEKVNPNGRNRKYDLLEKVKPPHCTAISSVEELSELGLCASDRTAISSVNEWPPCM